MNTPALKIPNFVLAVAFACLIQAFSHGQTEKRVWSDSSGTFSVEAELVRYTTTVVTLKKLNGSVINVPIARLSEFDSKFIQRLKDDKIPRETATVPASSNSLPAKPKSKNQLTFEAKKHAINKAHAPAPNPTITQIPIKSFAKSNGLAKSKDANPAAKREPIDLKPTTSLNAIDLVAGKSKPNSTIFEALKGNNRTKTVKELNNGGLDFAAIPEPNQSNRASLNSNASGLTSLSTSRPTARQARPASLNSTSRPTKDLTKVLGTPVNPTNKQARPIRIQPNALAIGQPLSADEYLELTTDVGKLADRKKVRSSLERLSNRWPAQPNPQLIQSVRAATKYRDPKSRKLAVDLLANFDAKQSLPWIIEAMDDASFSVRWAAYSWLEELQDNRAIKPLCQRLASGGGNHAAKILASFGSEAEPYVVLMIKNKSNDVKLTACSLLAEIGSEKSLNALESLVANTKKVSVKMQANNAIKSIQKRLSGSQQ